MKHTKNIRNLNQDIDSAMTGLSSSFGGDDALTGMLLNRLGEALDTYEKDWGTGQGTAYLIIHRTPEGVCKGEFRCKTKPEIVEPLKF